jgi:histidine triad (HIT) family protein
MATLFTRIISGDIPGTIVKQNDDVVALLDIDPKAPTHLLIVPRKEIASINDIGPDDVSLVGKMVLMARDIAVENGIADDGYRLVFNVGADGGQTVDHIHLHVLGGRELTWPPG